MSVLLAYVGLLFVGLICFLAHAVLPFAVARRLRRDHPQHWQVVAEPGADGRVPGGLQLWVRMQHVMRSAAIPAIDDAALTRLWRSWRYTQWLAFACWAAALALQWRYRH